MPRILTLARMPLADAEAKARFIKFLSDASDYALKNEPGIVKYAVCIPRDDQNSNIVWAVEEYSDQAVLDSHMTTPTVKAMIEWMSSGTRLNGEPQISQLEMLDGMHFSRPNVLSSSDPHILVADLSYQPGAVNTSMPYWKAVVETGRKNEPGTWIYALNKDPKDENRLVVLETYESPAYLTDVHVPSKAIQESVANTKHLRTGLVHTKLKFVHGFLHRNRAGESLL